MAQDKQRKLATARTILGMLYVFKPEEDPALKKAMDALADWSASLEESGQRESIGITDRATVKLVDHPKAAGGKSDA